MMSSMLYGCVAAHPAQRHSSQKVTVITTSRSNRPPKHTHKKVVVKKVIVGTRVKTRPSNSITIIYKSEPLLFSAGYFYREYKPGEYEVIAPEIGMVVPALPKENTKKIRMNSETLYLFEGTLYKKIPTQEGIQYRITGFMEE